MSIERNKAVDIFLLKVKVSLIFCAVIDNLSIEILNDWHTFYRKGKLLINNPKKVFGTLFAEKQRH